MTPPVIARSRAELAVARKAMSGKIAVVMTMGALHDGHIQLIDVAKQRADSVLVTIFVNPLQFGAGEDLDRYPRTFDADVAICSAHGVGVIFAPGAEDMYPPGEAVVSRHAGELGERLEGAVRPTHFDGVLTVVALLLELTHPDIAVFGEKDAQQLALIRRLVAAEGYPTDIVGIPIVREPDGLAMSSRNRYLDSDERQTALTLSRALRAGEAAAADGAIAVAAAVRDTLADEAAIAVDYVAVVDEETWLDPTTDTRNARILVAGRIGKTRLIDNVSVVLGTHHVG